MKDEKKVFLSDEETKKMNEEWRKLNNEVFIKEDCVIYERIYNPEEW